MLSKIRMWLSVKFFKLSVWLLPINEMKSREEKIDQFIMLFAKSEKCQKFIPMATGKQGGKFGPEKVGTIEY